MVRSNQIIKGDALTQLKTLPEKSINMCMTSPPYWALRDYSVEGQLGLEPTFDQYISNLCDIFDEVKRVLRDDGTCWVNLGDTYGGIGHSDWSGNKTFNTSKLDSNKDFKLDKKFQQKSLVMIPFRFAIEMVNRGWILRLWVQCRIHLRNSPRSILRCRNNWISSTQTREKVHRNRIK